MRVGIIGFGNMGRAIAFGLKKSEPDVELFAYDKAAHAVDLAAGAQVVSARDSAAKVCSESDIVIIAVKPQDTAALFRDLSGGGANSKFLSIVAGRSILHFQEGLGTSQVIRCMPNLAATVGLALVGISMPPDVHPDFRKMADRVVRSIGTPVEVPEELLPAITGISGSGIAFVLAFLHAMALGGTKAGLTYDVALESAAAVIKGACALVEKSGEHPIALLSKVASPAGTTIAGLTVLEERAFGSAVIEAVNAAAIRARELEK